MTVTDKSFQYDVFISYSSKDRSWALKLLNALESRGFKPFLDKKRLDIGKPWEPPLAKAVQTSQHLVVLWSEHAEQSPWVRRELGVFEAIVDPGVFESGPASRRFIFIKLHGTNPAYSGLQMFEINDPNAYSAGAENVSSALWEDLVKSISDAIAKDDPSIPIPLAVLAMTKPEIEQLNAIHKPDFGPDLNTLLTTLGIGVKDNLMGCYGAQRVDWKPFGGKTSIGQLLENIIQNVNQSMTGVKFRWAPIDAEFWTNIDVAKREQARMLSQFSVVIIDPLSLYDNVIYTRLVLLSQCFYNRKSLILVLTPLPMAQPIIDLSTLIQQRGTPFFDPYYDPPVPYQEKYAVLGVNIGDQGDMRRLLRCALGQCVTVGTTESTPEYLKVAKL